MGRRNWGTSSAVALSEMKDDRRRKMAGDGDRTVVGFWSEMENDGGGLMRKWSPELEDGRRWKTAGTGRTTENERWPKMENDGGRRWRKTVAGCAWWSTVGRKWVDGEREGKFGGKLGGNGNEKMEYCSDFVFKFFNF
jgi:hypothetical protein